MVITVATSSLLTHNSFIFCFASSDHVCIKWQIAAAVYPVCTRDVQFCLLGYCWVDMWQTPRLPALIVSNWGYRLNCLTLEHVRKIHRVPPFTEGLAQIWVIPIIPDRAYPSFTIPTSFIWTEQIGSVVHNSAVSAVSLRTKFFWSNCSNIRQFSCYWFYASSNSRFPCFRSYSSADPVFCSMSQVSIVFDLCVCLSVTLLLSSL